MKNLAVIIALLGASSAITRRHHPRVEGLTMLSDLYSNELANGDVSDDKELEKEDDMEDAIVDVQGHTNRGYGSEVPSAYFAGNHILEGSHIQVPRMDGPQPLRNSPNY